MTITAAELKPGDEVVLDDGNRVVDHVVPLYAAVQWDGKGRVGIWWAHGVYSEWLARETCEVIR